MASRVGGAWSSMRRCNIAGEDPFSCLMLNENEIHFQLYAYARAVRLFAIGFSRLRSSAHAHQQQSRSLSHPNKPTSGLLGTRSPPPLRKLGFRGFGMTVLCE